MVRFRRGRGPAQNHPRWRSQKKSAPLSQGIVERVNQGKRSGKLRENGTAAVGGAKVGVGVTRGGVGTDATDMDTARVEGKARTRGLVEGGA